MVTANWRGCDVVHETTKPITAPFKQPAAGAGVELDATAVIARATVAGIRIALIIDTYQRFRFIVVNIFTSICVHLLTIKCPQIFRHTNVIVSYLQCNKIKPIVSCETFTPPLQIFTNLGFVIHHGVTSAE